MRPKNTKIGWFAKFKFITDQGPPQFEIGRQKGSKLFRWMNFYQIFKNKRQEVKKRWEKKSNELGGNYKFNDYYENSIQRYSHQHPDLTIVTSSGSKASMFFLVDLRRKKILKSTSITALDILDHNDVRSLLSDQIEPQEEDEEHQAAPNDQLILLGFRDSSYLPKSRSHFILGNLNKIEFTLKVSDPFSSDYLKRTKIFSRGKFSYSYSRIISFGEDRLLTFYSGEVRSTYLRPLAWLDPETLQETKIPGLDKAGRSHLLFSLYELDEKYSQKLGKNRMLTVNRHLMYIYDFEQDNSIAEQTYSFGRNLNQFIFKIDDLYLGSQAKTLYMLKTRKDSQSGAEVIEKNKVIDFNDFIQNLSPVNGSLTSNVRKLQNGNYLYVGTKFIDGDARDQPGYEYTFVRMEINSETLDVINFSSILPDDQIDPKVNVYDIQFVQNSLVLACKIRRTENDNDDQRGDHNSCSLALATTDFEILDSCPLAKINTFGSILSVSSNRVASLGLENTIHLHEIDHRKSKLVLLKTLMLGQVKVQGSCINLKSSSSVWVLAKNIPEEGQEGDVGRTLLKFDFDLNLVKHLKVRGTNLDCVFPINETKVVFFDVQSRQQGFLFVMDVETREVRLACKKIAKYSPPNYVIENQAGDEKLVSVEFGGDKIEKVLLN